MYVIEFQAFKWNGRHQLLEKCGGKILNRLRHTRLPQQDLFSKSSSFSNAVSSSFFSSEISSSWFSITVMAASILSSRTLVQFPSSLISLVRWATNLDVAAESSLCSMLLNFANRSAYCRAGGGWADRVSGRLSVSDGASISPDSSSGKGTVLEARVSGLTAGSGVLGGSADRVLEEQSLGVGKAEKRG